MFVWGQGSGADAYPPSQSLSAPGAFTCGLCSVQPEVSARVCLIGSSEEECLLSPQMFVCLERELQK